MKEGVFGAVIWLRRHFGDMDHALIGVNVLPVLLVIFVYFSPDSLFRIAAFHVIAVYVAFQMVVFAALRMRIMGWKPGGPFSLGKWALPINVVALLYGTCAVIILSRPSGDTSLAFYDPWIALIGFAVVVFIGRSARPCSSR